MARKRGLKTPREVCGDHRPTDARIPVAVSRRTCPWVLLPTSSPQRKRHHLPQHPSSASPPAQRAWRALGPPWAFFDPQRAEGEAELARMAGISGATVPSSGSVLSRASRPRLCCQGEGLRGMGGRVGLGHCEDSLAAGARLQSRCGSDTRWAGADAGGLAGPPRSPWLPGPHPWGRGTGGRHCPGTSYAGAPTPGHPARGSPLRLQGEVGQWGPWGLRATGDPGPKAAGAGALSRRSPPAQPAWTRGSNCWHSGELPDECSVPDPDKEEQRRCTARSSWRCLECPGCFALVTFAHTKGSLGPGPREAPSRPT